MQLTVCVQEAQVRLRLDLEPSVGLGLPAVTDVEDGASLTHRLEHWAERYRRATPRNDREALVSIGSEIYTWLSQGNDLTRKWTQREDRRFEVLPCDGSAPELEDALYKLPWELLHEKGFLAQNLNNPLIVSRRVAPESAGSVRSPKHGDLRMLFMAAAPEGQNELDYEAEEVAILDATQGATGSTLVHLMVEESGALDYLAERLDGSDGDYEILHLSCHGNILAPVDQNTGKREGVARPILLLEQPEGGAHEVTATDLFTGCSRAMPPLVFLSACTTAQDGGDQAMRGAGNFKRDAASDPFKRASASDQSQALAEPFAKELAKNVPNVLGWDGSVFDHDATDFARDLYHQLGRGTDLPLAAASARATLFNQQANDPERGRHWHLARLYLGRVVVAAFAIVRSPNGKQ